MEAVIKRMAELGVIEQVGRDYASPLILVEVEVRPITVDFLLPKIKLINRL